MSWSATSVSVVSYDDATGFEMPFNLDVDHLYEFDHVEVIAEDAHGAGRIADDDARDFIEKEILQCDHVFGVMSGEDQSFRAAGWKQPEAEPTLAVPLAWLNRIVKVSLTHGEVLGILSDQSLRDQKNVYIMTLPGKPASPPIPVHLVLSISLIPYAFCYAFERSLDEEFDVRTYLYQHGEVFHVKELHTRAGRSALYVDDIFYHMEYKYKVSEEAEVSGAFYRWPAPGARDTTAAENDDFRLRWAALNSHHLVGESLGAAYHHAFNEEDQPALSE